MPRRRRDETKAGRWSIQVGEYGATVRIRERERGGRVQLVYQPTGKGRRNVYAQSVDTVRDRHGRIDEAAVETVTREAKKLADTLLADRVAEGTSGQRLTLAQGFALFHDPDRGALPTSATARRHHARARRYWLLNIEPDTGWNAVRPADAENAARKLARAGKVPTAEKYVRCFRTVYRWLRDKAGYDTLRDPTRGLDLRKLREGHEVRRPYYRPAEMAALHVVARGVDPRFEFALIWADDSGARSAALYRAKRSQVDEPLDVEPSAEQAPFGWANLPAMKGQGRALTFLTDRQRAVFDRALETYLRALEDRWLLEQRDYPLIPGGRFPASGVFGTELVGPVSNKMLEKWLRAAEKAAKVPHVKRRGWHGIRRGWAEYTLDSTGDIETVRDAGSWVDRSTVDEIYLKREKFTRLARSRQAQEGKADE
jgi:hypothetical protein